MPQIELPNKADIRLGDTEVFSNLPPETQAIVIKWIGENFKPRKTPLDEWTSYGLKHLIKNNINIYMTNCQFKGAMLQCGFEPEYWGELNWVFGLSKRSPAFMRGLRAI